MKQLFLNIKYCLELCVMLFLFNNNTNAQSITQLASKKVEVIKTEGIVLDNQIYSLGADKKTTTIEYIDGLARTVQGIVVQGSPTQKDIVSPALYDQYGRRTTEFLPYTVNATNGSYQTNALVAQQAFYSNGSSDKIADDTKPYAKKEYENSPLNRLLREGSVGDGFQPDQKYKSTIFRTNSADDNVRVWKTDGTSISVYGSGLLQVTEVTDQDGNKSLLFKDKLGRNILKRVQAEEVINGVSRPFFDTYYIYNDIDKIKYIITPKATALMQTANNWSVQNSQVVDLIYSFIYDQYGHAVEKKVPGSGPIYMIYDGADRPILVQDANLRIANKWYYCKYNSKQQIIAEGIYQNTTITTRAAMQTFVTGLNLQISSYEERIGTAVNGYSNQVFPTTQIEELTYYYYDDYDLNGDGNRDFSYQPQSIAGEATPSYIIRGQLTVVKKKIIGSSTWLNKIFFYDKRGNNIQIIGNNQIYSTGNNDSKTIVPDFTGKVMKSKVVKATSASAKTTVLGSFNYDHSGRIISVEESYNGAAAIQVAAYQYNELGQLVEKGLHKLNGINASQDNIELSAGNSVSSGQSSTVVAFKTITLKNGFVAAQGSQFNALISSGFLQSVDYRYNIQGQIISINNSSLKNDTKNDDADDLFGMEIFYNTEDASIGNTKYYNGRISAIKWRSMTPSDNNPKERGYRYNYDKLNRLKDAFYLERSTGGSWGNAGAFDEKGITYDENGNILSLVRNTYQNGIISESDNLTYSYQGNQLTNVIDNGNTAQGFKNLTGSSSSFEYNSSGSLKTDPKKGITIDYNVLNKDDKITITAVAGRFIKYTYDGGGSLLKKQVYDNNILKKTTDYIEGFVFEDGVLSYFGMTEGRVRNTGTGLKPEYMLSDHQGNVRVSFEEQNGKAIVRQDNSYYPYGLIMAGNSIPSQPNRNLYNGGSEWQNDFGDLPDYYKTYYRNYDAALGRFIAIDIRADEYNSLSPYQYALNNPVSYNDPFGDKVPPPIIDIIQQLNAFTYGGSWTNTGNGGTFSFYSSAADAFQAGAAYMDQFGSWGMYGFATDYQSGERAFNSSQSRVDQKSSGRKDFIVMGVWYHNSDGTPKLVDNVSATMRLVDLRENNVASQNILGDALNILGKLNDGISGLAEGVNTNGFNNAKLYIGQIRPSVAYGFRVYMKPVIQSNIGKSLGRTANIAGIAISAATVANTYLEEGYRGPKTTMEMGKAVTGMAGAWAGARIGAAAGGVLGSFFPILGNGVGAIAGGIIGGIAGGIGGSLIAEEVYN